MRWVLLFTLFAASVAACAQAGASPQRQRASLEDFGLAPELENKVWLNTDRPLQLKELRGKVVLLDMWTFG